MTHHCTIHAIFNHVTEGSQLDVVHLFHGTGHSGQGHVRVSRRVAVTWEVFHRGYQAIALHAQGVGRCHVPNFFGIFTKAAHANDGI